MFKLTEDLVKNILKGNPDYSEWFEVLDELLPKYQIDTAERVAGFFAQCQHESSNFRVMAENLNYSASRLKQVFGKRVANIDVNEYAHKPEKIANHVYANMIGNGDVASGDGWRFRGRGIIQLTGRSNYVDFSKDIGMSLEQVIPYLETKRGAVEAACWYWKRRNINAAADNRDIVRMTKLVNGGRNGLADRTQYYQRALAILGLSDDIRVSEPASSVLRLGDRGEAVKRVQRALGLAEDGVFGPGTQAAVRQFQSKNNLTVDGVVGPQTMQKLFG